MSLMDDYFKETLEYDFFRMFCGDLIGNGAGRFVYNDALDDKYVIKIEQGPHSFQNIREWDLWNDAQYSDHVIKWLAPCKFISPNGKVLIQRKTKPAKKYPEKLPVYFTDTKRANFGMIGNRFVCHDYGTNLVVNQGLYTKRLRKVEWWD